MIRYKYQINENVRLPAQKDRNISIELQKAGDEMHKMDVRHYESAILLLSSDNREQLHEAVLVAENYLSYNGAWDFERKFQSDMKVTNDRNVIQAVNKRETPEAFCVKIRFKWNGYASMADKMYRVKLPCGVQKEFID